MGVNILLFLLFQVAVEPWRRKRLVKGFEDKVMEALEREGSAGAMLAEIHASKEVPSVADATEEINSPVVEGAQPELEEKVQEIVDQEEKVEEDQVLPDPISQPSIPLTKSESVKETLRDLFSERRVTVRRVDLTNAMLEGAAAGVAFVGVLVLLLRPR